MVAKLMEDVSLWTTREAALGKSGSLEDLVAVRAIKEETETLSDLSETLRRLKRRLLIDLAQEVPSTQLQLVRNKLLLKMWQSKRRSRLLLVLL